MPLHLPLPLLCPLAAAAAGLPDPASYQSMGWLIAGVAGLAVACNQIMGAVVNLRKLRAPTPEETENLARFAALATEIREVELRVEKRMSEMLGGIHTRLGTLEASISRAIADINYAIGKIDGQSS